jgi:hypothetical protein
METEAVVADTVRRRVDAENTGDRLLADRAVNYALSSYAGGASAAEAIEGARKFVRAWVHHPSHWHRDFAVPAPEGVVASVGAV